MTQSLTIRYENVDLIGELTRETAAADRARATAEAANRDKTQFLAAASHDLRQPLHAMGLFGAALAARVEEPAAREIVDCINASVEALERQFTALMDISKLDAGAVTPSRARFPLAPLFARLEREFAPLAAARRLAPLDRAHRRMGRQRSGTARARARQLRFERGATYRARRRRPRRASARGRMIAIEVRDTGAGIPGSRARTDIRGFLPDSSGDAGAGQGMGLGLAIIRRLAALLDHPIEVDSTPGARLALCRRGAARSGAIRMLAAATAECPAGSLAGALIAVVDDESAIVDAMRFWFAQWGAQVCGGGSGDDVLAALGELGRYPDLIVADYRLAGGALGTDAVALPARRIGPADTRGADQRRCLGRGLCRDAFHRTRRAAEAGPAGRAARARRAPACRFAGPSGDGSGLLRRLAWYGGKKERPAMGRMRTDRVRRPCSDPGGGVDPACERPRRNLGSAATAYDDSIIVRQRPKATPSVAAGRRISAPRRTALSLSVRRPHLRAERLSLRDARVDRVTHGQLLIGRQGVIQREPGRARLLAQPAVLLLHLIGQCRQRRQVGRALGKLGFG